MQQQGVVTTYKKVMNKLDSYTPLGYSLCGVVTEVGKGAEEFKVGQLVACAGNEQALHAEYNWVPVNLCAAVPAGVLPEHAAFATVASIAMHGVRRAEVQLGETAAVIGLGLIGQLVVRLLAAAGVQAIGIDPVPDRCRLAEKGGAVACGSPDDLDSVAGRTRARSPAAAARTTCSCPPAGTATGRSRRPCKLARDRARIIDIGKMKLDLPWNAYYEKELDVRFSRSYGPGRYDTRYELDGIDYPAGYVRWTEKRNLESFLDLVARNELEVATLIDGVFPMTEAAKVYEDLKSGALKAIGVLLEYPVPAEDAPAPATKQVLPGAKPPPVRKNSCRPPRSRSRSASSEPATTRRPCCCRTWPSCRGEPRARRHHQVAVGGQRAEEVRLHHGVDRLGLGLRGRVARRDLHRDQARHARQAGLPGA